MKNYQKVNVPAGEARVELHDSLNLTGAEVSISNLPAGAGVPFVHSHKQNEEIYAVLSGRGTMVVDGETVELQAGDWLRVAPAGERQLSAAADSAISVICIQVKAGSLEGFTMTDILFYENPKRILNDMDILNIEVVKKKKRFSFFRR